MQIWNAWLYTFLFTDGLITYVHSPNIYSVHSTHFWKRAANTEFISKLCFGLYKEGGMVFCVSRVTRPVRAAEYEKQFCTKNLSSQNSLNCANTGFCSSLATGKYWFGEAGFGAQRSCPFWVVSQECGTPLGCPPSSWRCLRMWESTRSFHRYTQFPENINDR